MKKVRRIACDLRYRTIDKMVGETVVLTALDPLGLEIQAFVDRFVPGCVGPAESLADMTATLTKYMILELEFDAPQRLLDFETRSGISLLKELHFIGGENDSDPDQSDFDGWGCLEDLERSLDKGKTLLKLFLRGKQKPPFRVATERLFESASGEESSANIGKMMSVVGDISLLEFPQEFRVIDACVTNSDFVWFCKHFYM